MGATEARKGAGTHPRSQKDQWGSGLLAQGSFLPEAPTEPPEEARMWYPVTQGVKKKILLGIPATRDKRSGSDREASGRGDGQMNHLRTGGCGTSQRLPGNQGPLNFPPASIRALQPRGTCWTETGKRRGRASWPCWKWFHSFSTPATSGMSLGWGQGTLASRSSTLNPAVTPRTRRWTELRVPSSQLTFPSWVGG